MDYRCRRLRRLRSWWRSLGIATLGAEAEKTLGSWNEESLVEVASDATTPQEVLLYLLSLHAHRPAVVKALCENPTLALETLEAAATHAGGAVLRAMLRSDRVRNSSRLLELITANPAAEPAKARLDEWLAKVQGKEAQDAAEIFLTEHAEEIVCGEQPFELVSAAEGEDDALDTLLSRAKTGDTEATEPEVNKQLSLLQRIGSLRVGERIKLAMRGNREERMVLIRDRSKLVSLAVLESPKVNDSEMETFAAMKNIQEAVLRAISTKRNYIKNYGVVRALVEQSQDAAGCCAAIDVAFISEGSAVACDE